MVPDASQLALALADFEAFLRKKRLKMTAQRRTLVHWALTKHGHFTADELSRKLLSEGETISMATVYRALALLEEAELLEGHDFADGTRRYERAHGREHHDHMICLDCRAVIEFTNEKIERLQEKAAADQGYTLGDHSLTLFVRCNAWREAGACAVRTEHESPTDPVGTP